MLEFFLRFDLTTVLVFFLMLIISLWLFDNGRKKFPPGPMGLPVVGYLPFLGKKPWIKLMELRKIYGPVYSVRLGGITVVILADFPTIKEAFFKEAFIGRADALPIFSKESVETRVFTDLPWKILKRFTLQSLRDLGLGKSRLEINIAEEINELLGRFETQKGKPIFPRRILSPSTSNNIASLLFGNRKTFDDPKRIMLDNIVENIEKFSQGAQLLELFPFLGKIFFYFKIGISKKIVAAISAIKRYVRGEIQEHTNTFDPNYMRDIIDKFLLEVENQKNDPKSIFQIPILEDFSFMLFFAGSSAVRSTLEWLMLICAAYPEVQKKVQGEIDEVIGKERFPARSDYKEMPYTEATIMETLRWRASLPINFPKYTIQEDTVGSYKIPKHVRVIGLTWAVHHDPDLWGEDVESFKPERFLSEDGKKIKKPEYYIPFSIGKRSCIGESLAYVEIFMYFAAILRKFHLRLPEGAKPDLEGVATSFFEAKPYEICFDLR